MLLLAVYRPGLDGIMDAILSRRHGRDPVQFAHPSLESVLAETFGELVYQEQVIRIAIEVAGFDGSAAVAFQRKMSTRYDEVGCRRVFTIGAAGKEFDEMTAGAIFRQLTRAQQAVWKSHAAATATRAWRSAWLKAHYPAEFAEAVRHACDCEVRRFWHAR
jgi:DNA polymerase-3 subunit alpha